VEEMKFAHGVLALGLLLYPAFAQSVPPTAFDRYVKSVKTHSPQQRFVKAAVACGLDLTKSHTNYGTNSGLRFYRTQNFAKSVYDLESDFFSTAALWTEGDRARMIDFWSIDDSEGSEMESIICLDDQARAKDMQITRWSYPMEDGFPGWVYERHIKFGPNGAIVNDTSGFKDLSLLRTIKKPKLEADEESGLKWFPGNDMVSNIIKQLMDRRK
jgi:hypothetical protein